MSVDVEEFEHHQLAEQIPIHPSPVKTVFLTLRAAVVLSASWIVPGQSAQRVIVTDNLEMAEEPKWQNRW